MQRCILAFSGGLEQLAAVRWLREQHNSSVTALVLDLGQGEDLEELGEQALAAGASSSQIADARAEFAKTYVLPCLRALAHYEHGYLLCSALSRPAIAAETVRLAEAESAVVVAHGCSSQGNDQVRLETALKVLAPHLRVLAPQREWPFKNREELADYVRSRGLHPRGLQSTSYRLDRNLWGQSITRGLDAVSASSALPEEAFTLTVAPEKAPDEPRELELEFTGGVPVMLNGRKMPPAALLEQLTETAGACGVGRSELIEDRLVGFKSRETYEAPAAEVLYTAKRALERRVLGRETLAVRELLAEVYGRCVYDGYWFGALREALDSFFLKLNETVEGRVVLRLYKGDCRAVVVESPYSLLPADAKDRAIAYFGRAEAEGFIKIHASPAGLELRRRRARRD